MKLINFLLLSLTLVFTSCSFNSVKESSRNIASSDRSIIIYEIDRDHDTFLLAKMEDEDNMKVYSCQ